MINNNLTPEQAFQKIKHFCAYQERSHYEVRERLFSMGLYKIDVETLLSRLIEENYLNEERFAIQFAGGHFRQKKWGKIKIVYELKQKRVSALNIKKALQEIDKKEYLATLQKLAAEKWYSLRGEQYLNRESKTKRFLLGKGYENGLILEVITQIKTAAKE